MQVDGAINFCRLLQVHLLAMVEVELGEGVEIGGINLGVNIEFFCFGSGANADELVVERVEHAVRGTDDKK
jgi:hypothetical protein